VLSANVKVLALGAVLSAVVVSYFRSK